MVEEMLALQRDIPLTILFGRQTPAALEREGLGRSSISSARSANLARSSASRREAIAPVRDGNLLRHWGLDSPYRLRRLIRQVRHSANTDQSMDWLKPFMTKRTYKKGKVVFRKNDRAYEMYYVVTGKFLVTEIGATIPAGQVFGELGMLAPDNRRTSSVECVETGVVLTITMMKSRSCIFRTPRSVSISNGLPPSAFCRTRRGWRQGWQRGNCLPARPWRRSANRARQPRHGAGGKMGASCVLPVGEDTFGTYRGRCADHRRPPMMQRTCRPSPACR
jgi:Cyclic nucleotide-binding domain